MGTKVRTSTSTEVIYESLSTVERRAVDRLLRHFDLRIDEISLEVGSDAYREVANINGQLSLFNEGDSE